MIEDLLPPAHYLLEYLSLLPVIIYLELVTYMIVMLYIPQLTSAYCLLFSK
jgi:hypothetical protein